jgi:carbon storage regulator
MLVLTRRKNEKIVIGGGIVLTVVTIQGNRVRLGIEAPPEVPVQRQEIARSLEPDGPLVPVPPTSAPALLASPQATGLLASGLAGE